MRELILFGALAALGCGKEIGRVPFTAEGTKETHVEAAAKEVVFWSDVDLEWEGAGSAGYDVDLLQNGSKVASTTCDLLARPKVRMSWVETNIGGHHTRRGRGRMDCTVSLPSGGDTLVRAKLRVSNVDVRSADLVVKQ